MSHATDWYRPPVNALSDEQIIEAIDALTTKFESPNGSPGGSLATLVFNTRNSYMALPDRTFDSTTVRMIVEGFLAEIDNAPACTDPSCPCVENNPVTLWPEGGGS